MFTTMDKKEVKDTLKAANEYLKLLNNLQTELNYAEQQVNKTTQESETKIAAVFENLIATTTASLISRRNELINEINTIKQHALTPLRESQILISNKIKNTSNFVVEGRNLLDKEVARSEIEEFNLKSSLLGSLPEVPSLKEVPYVSFQHYSVDEGRIIDTCKSFGSVMHIAPVQISTLVERPGGILIDWNVGENEERVVEKYHLQKAFGEVNSNRGVDHFRTCYIGADTRCLVKDLVLNQNYTFRVSCKFEGDKRWNPWSLSEIAKTSIRSFCWDVNESFILNNDSKIASPSRTNSMLYSKQIEFSLGYSVELTFLECDDNVNNTFVGLFDSNKRNEFMLIESSICFETNGNIYGSGVKKAMQFAPVVKDTKICFTCNHKGKDKLRIDLDCGNSRVTYDWFVNEKCIYVGVWCNSKKWKIAID